MCQNPFRIKKCHNTDLELIFIEPKTGKPLEMCYSCWNTLNKKNPDWEWNPPEENSIDTENTPLFGSNLEEKLAQQKIETPLEIYIPYTAHSWIRKDTVKKSKTIREYLKEGEVNLRDEVQQTKKKKRKPKKKIRRK